MVGRSGCVVQLLRSGGDGNEKSDGVVGGDGGLDSGPGGYRQQGAGAGVGRSVWGPWSGQHTGGVVEAARDGEDRHDRLDPGPLQRPRQRGGGQVGSGGRWNGAEGSAAGERHAAGPDKKRGCGRGSGAPTTEAGVSGGDKGEGGGGAVKEGQSRPYPLQDRTPPGPETMAGPGG